MLFFELKETTFIMNLLTKNLVCNCRSSGSKPVALPKWLALQALAIYQSFFALFLGGACRFQPSCSEYAKEAFSQHSFWQAVRLSVYRLSKCHPLGPQGHDPVPKVEGEL